MESRQLAVLGAVEFTPAIHRDARGEFLEQFRFEALRDAVGVVPEWRQTNVSLSARGVVRGVHYSIRTPGQAKYVTAVAGRAIDFVVDVRPGSPSFGRWDAVELDAAARRAVFVPAGVGHACAALEDGTALSYLCSEVFDPDGERAMSPFDPELGLDLPFARDALIVSERYAAAPTLAEAVAAGAVRVYDGSVL